MKQALISMGIVLVAAGILGGIVLYTVAVIRQYERQILTGQVEISASGDLCEPCMLH